MKVFAAITLLLVVIACQKENRTFDNLNGGKIDAIGHGGGGIQNLNNPFPWNSYKSISSGIADNADALELDVRMSADSVLMLFHDRDLVLATDCDGCVSTRHAADLSACIYRQGLLPSLSGQHVLSLEACLSFLRSEQVDVTLYLDVHFGDQCGEAVSLTLYEKISSEIEQLRSAYPGISDWRIICLDDHFLSVMQADHPDVQHYLEGDLSDENIQLAQLSGFEGMVNAIDKSEAYQIRRAHAAGQKVILFSPFDQWSHEEAFDMHPDGIITDNLRLMHNLLN